jgi:hypothetical protein
VAPVSVQAPRGTRRVRPKPMEERHGRQPRDRPKQDVALGRRPIVLDVELLSGQARRYRLGSTTPPTWSDTGSSAAQPWSNEMDAAPDEKPTRLERVGARLECASSALTEEMRHHPWDQARVDALKVEHEAALLELKRLSPGWTEITGELLSA